MKKIPKKWRELSKEERFKIPVKYFNIDIKTLNRIRKISDSKKRLIEAARIQCEMFNDIHSYLTVWIAGYGSDVVIRQKFGSTQNLLNLFFKPIEFPKNIKPSWQDIKRRIKIPEDMTEELAEETGIHIGDGHLCVGKDKKWESYYYGITGDLIEESIYHETHIKKLLKGLYNIESSILKRESKNSIESRCKSKTILEFKNKILNLPIGPKKNIKIPKKILDDENFQKRCIIGIIDTDFSITSSLAITGKINNLFVALDMHKILDKNKIMHIFKKYKDYSRFYINKKGAIKILKEWGLKNEKHLSKYRVSEEFGKFLPFSTTPERLALLAGKLDIQELEKISKKRRASIKARKNPRFPFT